MIKHLFKIVWNRKRANALITIEIFFSFLVVFTVVTIGAYYLENYRHPLGFSYQEVWNVSVNYPFRLLFDPQAKAQLCSTAKRLLQEAGEVEGVESVGAVSVAPYSLSSNSRTKEADGRKITFMTNRATDTLPAVLGIELIAGRWFGKEDDGAAWVPAVINKKMARELFGDEDPLGKDILDSSTPPAGQKRERVVGLIGDFRKDGEFAELYNYCFYRIDPNNMEQPPSVFLIKVRAGATAQLEEQLVARLQGLAKDWSFSVERLADMRRNSVNLRLILPMGGGLLAAFLIFMVGLGLTGVVWQSVTQRTSEIGLRRASGASARSIHTQIAGELLVIAALGLILGVAVVVQFPLLQLVGFISAKVYGYSLAISVFFILLLTLLCAVYPSRFATRIHPAKALHYE